MSVADRVKTATAGYAMLTLHKLNRRLGALLGSHPFELMPHMANMPREALTEMWKTTYDAYNSYFTDRFCCDEKITDNNEWQAHQLFCGSAWNPDMWGGGEPADGQKIGCDGHYECHPHPNTKWNAVARSMGSPRGIQKESLKYDPTILSFDGGPLHQGDTVSARSLEALCQLLANHATTTTTVLHLTPPIPVIADTWWFSPDAPCDDAPFLPQLLAPFQSSVADQIESVCVGFVPSTNQSFRIGECAVNAIDELSGAIDKLATVAVMLDQTPSSIARFCACATRNRLRNVLICTTPAGGGIEEAMEHVAEMLHREVGQHLENVVLLTQASSWNQPWSEACKKLVQASRLCAVNVSLHDRDFAHCLNYMDDNCRFSRCKCCALTRVIGNGIQSSVLDQAYEHHSIPRNTSGPCALCSAPTTFNQLAKELALLRGSSLLRAYAENPVTGPHEMHAQDMPVFYQHGTAQRPRESHIFRPICILQWLHARVE